MNPDRLLNLAHDVTDNDPGKNGPLVKLLFVFKESRDDPLSTAIKTGVIRALFSEMDESEQMGLMDYVRDVRDNSLAA